MLTNTFNSPNLPNHSPYELVFGRRPKLLLDLETDPDVRVSGMHREYFLQLKKRLEYLHKLLQDFWMKTLALINKDREDFQYNSGDLVYIILPLTSQLRTASRKASIKYVGPLAVYKIVDPQNYLLITLDGKLLRVLCNPKFISKNNRYFDLSSIYFLYPLTSLPKMESPEMPASIEQS